LERKTIDFLDWQVKPYHLWDRQSLVLTSGDYHTGKYNSMIVGWGGFGTMWNKPFALVVVRPQRYTFEFMEKYDSFTLSALPNKYRSAINFIGSNTGRDFDKYEQAKLTPIPSTQISAPGLEEAELIIECRKSYWQDLDPANFLLSSIAAQYPLHDYHRIYFGEILTLTASEKFLN